MRISDWSSDVCSSDLRRMLCPAVARLDVDGTPRLLLRGRIEPGLLQAEGVHAEDGVIARHVGRPVRKGACDPVPEHARQIGRASWRGKSVSGRVDLGGGRILKKKKKKQIQRTE